MNSLELFAGIGGIALAEQLAGIKVVALSEMAEFPEDFLANLSVLPGSKKARKMTEISGRKCLELSKRSGPVGLLERMLLTSQRWNSTERYLTWKVLATKQGYLYFQLWPSGRHINGKEHLLWPTPTASDGSAWIRVAKGSILDISNETNISRELLRMSINEFLNVSETSEVLFLKKLSYYERRKLEMV